MKIGLLTRHHMYHHGAMLQAYGLQKVLKLIGTSVEIIDFRELSHERANKLIAYQPLSLIKNVSYLYYLKRSVTLIGWSIINIYQHILKKRLYNEFIYHWMKYGNTIYTNDSELSNTCAEYDAYIVGSDQIWKINEERGGLDLPFYLPFAPKDRIRIAYAASFGRPTLPSRYESELQELLTNFDYISLREASSIPFIQKFTDTQVVNVLDPALLLERKYWDELAQSPAITEPYLFVYSVTWNKNLSKFAKRVAKETGLKMICIGPDYTKLGLRDSVCGPDTFIGYIKNAALVVTDSFHGTVFSIQYEKMFYSYPPKGEETRISDLLHLLHLEGRFISSADDSFDPKSMINYSSVNLILEEQRTFSLNFLKNALGMTEDKYK